MGKMKEYWYDDLSNDNEVNYLGDGFDFWDWDENVELPPLPKEPEEKKETIDKHKNHEVVKNQVSPYGEPITFYYCRDCKVEVKKEK